MTWYQHKFTPIAKTHPIEQVIGQILIAPIQILNEENPGFGPRQQRRPERS